MATGTAKLPVELPGGKEAGQTMNDLIKSAVILNREMKQLAIGTEEFTQKKVELKEVNQQLAEIRQQTRGVSEASKELKEHAEGLSQAFAKFFPFAGELQEIGEKVIGVSKNVGGLTSTFTGLKSAIAATGIGALIIALTSLYQWTSRTAEGAVFMDTAWRGLENSTDVLLKSVSTLNFNVETLSVNMALAWAQAKEAAEVAHQLDISQRKTNETVSEADKIARQYLVSSRDVGKSFDDRLKALAKADEAEKKSLEAKQEQSKKLIEFAQEEVNAYKIRNQTTIASKELEDALSNAKVNANNLESESINLLERIANRRSQILKAQATEEEKLDNERKARRDKERSELEKEYNEQKEAANNIVQLKINVMKKGVDQEIAQIKLDTVRKMEAVKGSDAQIAEQILLLQDEQDKKINDAKKKSSDEENKITQDKLKKDADALLDFYKKQEELGKKEVEDKKRNAEVEKKIAEVKYATEKEAIDGIGTLVEQGIADEETAKDIKKGIATVDVGLNLQRELAFNAATAAANPLNAVTFGAAGAAELTALDTASYIRAAIAEAKVLAFEQGGIPDGVLRGPSHAQGGIPLVAEGNEIILTKGVYQDPGLRSLASALNQAGGGRSFAPPMDPNSRGSVAEAIGAAGGGGIGAEHIEGLKQTILVLADSMDKRIDRIEANVNLQEVQKGLNVLANLRSSANV